MSPRWILPCLMMALLPSVAFSEVPPPAQGMSPWPMQWSNGAPGIFSVGDLIDKPAGKNGPVVVRDGHFYTGDKRIRFWGVNLAFSACFPTHEAADALAKRLSEFGINSVRLHHMDNQPYPNGIWADAKVEKLSDEALDRLDYLIAALKKQGIYSDINLHVSRAWSKAHGWPNADQLPEGFDKILDLFHPDLMAVNKLYAKDLLTHVNKYTGAPYTREPAVCIVEINNEDTLFLWSGERVLATLPEPYAGMFQKLWNHWLVKKYATRDKLKAAWSIGALPLGENFLADEDFKTFGTHASVWNLEKHESAHMTATRVTTPSQTPAIEFDVTFVTATSWHLQFNQAKLHLKKGMFYTLKFSGSADEPTEITAAVQQAHAPYEVLGLGISAKLAPTWHDFSFGFISSEDDDNARISFSVGERTGKLRLGRIELREGGQEGLRDDEDPAADTVRPHQIGVVAARNRDADWFDFLQKTDQAHWVEMHRYLREDLGVQAPITGSFCLGSLGTLSQSKMDFVDAHSYWDHPHFPRRPWDPKDWQIRNKPMVDNPEGATLWALAATRVAGKPFTVTEYNHAAPNEWQAECMPMIASYAALQDWDGIYLFAYSHSSHYDTGRIDSYFNIEGNPAKMGPLPLAARIFLGQGVAPSPGTKFVRADYANMLATAPKFYNMTWPWAQQAGPLTCQDGLGQRIGIDFSFGKPPLANAIAANDARVAWSAKGPGSGQFTVNDPHADIFVGFAKPDSTVDVGPLRIDQIASPFMSLTLVPADPKQTIANADRLLLAVVGRAENTGMKWEPDRRSVSNNWGKAPAVVEVIKARLTLKGNYPRQVFAITPGGQRGAQVPSTRTADGVTFQIGGEKTIWYEISK